MSNFFNPTMDKPGDFTVMTMKGEELARAGELQQKFSGDSNKLIVVHSDFSADDLKSKYDSFISAGYVGKDGSYCYGGVKGKEADQAAALKKVQELMG